MRSGYHINRSSGGWISSKTSLDIGLKESWILNNSYHPNINISYYRGMVSCKMVSRSGGRWILGKTSSVVGAMISQNFDGGIHD
jgi:hypothetical protein